MNLEHRFRNIETDGSDRLHICPLRIVITSSATTFAALTCRSKEPSTASDPDIAVSSIFGLLPRRLLLFERMRYGIFSRQVRALEWKQLPS